MRWTCYGNRWTVRVCILLLFLYFSDFKHWTNACKHGDVVLAQLLSQFFVNVIWIQKCTALLRFAYVCVPRWRRLVDNADQRLQAVVPRLPADNSAATQTVRLYERALLHKNEVILRHQEFQISSMDPYFVQFFVVHVNYFRLLMSVILC
jgi:hypothetical protein